VVSEEATMDWRDEPVPPRVRDAAAEHGLGALLTAVRSKALTPAGRVLGGGAAFVGAPFLVAVLCNGAGVPFEVMAKLVYGVLAVAAVAAVLVALSGSRLYLFEGGAVVVGERRAALEVVPWAQLLPIEGEERTIRPDGGAPFPVLEVRGPRGRVFSCSHGEAVRLADVICSVELARAWAALQAGAAVHYGPLTLTRRTLAVGDLVLPWADVTRIRATGPQLVVRGAGPRGAGDLAGVLRVEVPHERTAIALGERMGAAARQLDPRRA
jgi:hypothetical protein